MFRLRSTLVVLLIYFYLRYSHASKSGKTRSKFEVVLENVQTCKNPSPPYAKKITIVSKYSTNIVNSKRYFSGNTTVTVPTQFVNFSARTYSFNDAGQRVLKFEISQVSCRNILARSILMFAKLSFSMKNCMIQKGYYSYKNMDLDKIAHSIPGWHAPGDVIHELQLVTNGTTQFCDQIKAKIMEVKYW